MMKKDFLNNEKRQAIEIVKHMKPKSYGGFNFIS